MIKIKKSVVTTIYLDAKVYFQYPKQLHDLCNNCPLAPEVMNVEANMLSGKQVEIYKTLSMKITNPTMRKPKS